MTIALLAGSKLTCRLKAMASVMQSACLICMVCTTALRQRNKMKIIKVPYWTNSRHHLLDDDGKVICITDSIMIVNHWIKQYGIMVE